VKGNFATCHGFGGKVKKTTFAVDSSMMAKFLSIILSLTKRFNGICVNLAIF